jgi:uncharacterized membrane protein
MKAGNMIRQIARISSIISIAAILYLFYDDTLEIIMRERQQIMLFLFFPVGAVAGRLLPWKWEGLSGLLTLTCLFVFSCFSGNNTAHTPRERSIFFLPLRGDLRAVSPDQ